MRERRNKKNSCNHVESTVSVLASSLTLTNKPDNGMCLVARANSPRIYNPNNAPVCMYLFVFVCLMDHLTITTLARLFHSLSFSFSFSLCAYMFYCVLCVHKPLLLPLYIVFFFSRLSCLSIHSWSFLLFSFFVAHVSLRF